MHSKPFLLFVAVFQFWHWRCSALWLTTCLDQLVTNSCLHFTTHNTLDGLNQQNDQSPMDALVQTWNTLVLAEVLGSQKRGRAIRTSCMQRIRQASQKYQRCQWLYDQYIYRYNQRFLYAGPNFHFGHVGQTICNTQTLDNSASVFVTEFCANTVLDELYFEYSTSCDN